MRRTQMCVAVLLVGALVGGCGSSGHLKAITKTGQTTLTTQTVVTTITSAAVTNAHPQPGWKHFSGDVPILVYHDLGNAPASEPYPGLYMPYSTFQQEMAWLHSQGYQAVTLDELMSDWYHDGTLPAKPIVITFDNGYPPQVTEAPEVMSKYGWPGVLDEITEDHLSLARLRSIIRLGWEVDSHSLTHPDLTELTPSQLTAQVAQSRSYLQKNLHIPVNSFCYPSSEYNAAVEAAVKAAGYEDATTEIPSYASPTGDPYQLPRFEMTAGLSQLQADLAQPH